jgi:alpha-maltose-1-phosphate synthase
MKILLLCEGDAETHNSWSGVSYGLVSGLRALGHEVRVGDCDLSGAVRLFGAGMTFSPMRRRWWVRYHLGAIPFWMRSQIATRHVKEAGDWPDVVLQFGATFMPSQELRTGFFLYCDSNIHLSELGAVGGRSEAAQLSEGELEGVRRRENSVYGKAQSIFTMSRMVADTFVEGFDVEKDRVIPVHAGMNFTPAGEINGTQSDRPTILFVGRDFARKGGDLLLEAFKLLKCSLPESRLVIAGPSSNPAPGVPDVEFLGFLDLGTAAGKKELKTAYEQADVFCLPTRFEPLGIVFLEAMAFGIPCVGPNEWAVPEMIVHGKTGLLVDGDDAASWSSTLHTVLTDREMSARMSVEGRKRVAEYFTWNRVAQDIIRVMKLAVLSPQKSGDKPS